MWLGELLQPLLWFPEKKKAKRLSLAFWRSVVELASLERCAVTRLNA